MKKNYLFLFLILVNSVVNAQSLTRNDIGYQVGDNFIIFQSTYQDPGSNGTGVSWNLSAMNNQFGEYNVTITNGSSAFPNSNIAINVSNGQKTYCQITNTSNEIIGSEYGSTIQNYTNTQTTLNFPVTPTSDFNDSYGYTSNGVIQSATGTIHEEFSGYGTLTTPTGTFTDVVRVKQTRIQSFTVNSATEIDTTVSYFWYKAGIHYQLASVSKSTLGNSENAYYTSAGSLSTEENQLFQVNIYPNPASETIKLQSNGKISDLKIYDLSGELVLDKAVTYSPIIELNISDLNSGIYFIHLLDENGTSSVKRFTKN